jgi:hypothetical protein
MGDIPAILLGESLTLICIPPSLARPLSPTKAAGGKSPSLTEKEEKTCLLAGPGQPTIGCEGE